MAYWARKTAGGAVGVTVIAQSFLKPISVRYGLEKVLDQSHFVLVAGSIQLFNDDAEFSRLTIILAIVRLHVE